MCRDDIRLCSKYWYFICYLMYLGPVYKRSQDTVIYFAQFYFVIAGPNWVKSRRSFAIDSVEIPANCLARLRQKSTTKTRSKFYEFTKLLTFYHSWQLETLKRSTDSIWQLTCLSSFIMRWWWSSSSSHLTFSFLSPGPALAQMTPQAKHTFSALWPPLYGPPHVTTQRGTVCYRHRLQSGVK